MSILSVIPEWTVSAVCAQIEPDLWFPEQGGGGREVAAAKKVCSECPVHAKCLQYALDNGERYGIWGGLSERERRDLAPRNRCRTCNGAIEGHPVERYCSDECRQVGRRKSQDASHKALACIQCGGPSTAVRCSSCKQKYHADLTLTRTQTKEAA